MCTYYPYNIILRITYIAYGRRLEWVFSSNTKCTLLPIAKNSQVPALEFFLYVGTNILFFFNIPLFPINTTLVSFVNLLRIYAVSPYFYTFGDFTKMKL